jgi:hypothetical protein
VTAGGACGGDGDAWGGGVFGGFGAGGVYAGPVATVGGRDRVDFVAAVVGCWQRTQRPGYLAFIEDVSSLSALRGRAWIARGVHQGRGGWLGL